MSVFIWVLPLSSPAGLFLVVAGPEETKNLAGKDPPPDSDPLNHVEFGENPASLSRQKTATPNRCFKFHKRRQLFIRAPNETLSVVAVCVCNPDCSSAGINR
jgi:hypothetical protein